MHKQIFRLLNNELSFDKPMHYFCLEWLHILHVWQLNVLLLKLVFLEKFHKNLECGSSISRWNFECIHRYFTKYPQNIEKQVFELKRMWICFANAVDREVGQSIHTPGVPTTMYTNTTVNTYPRCTNHHVHYHNSQYTLHVYQPPHTLPTNSRVNIHSKCTNHHVHYHLLWWLSTTDNIACTWLELLIKSHTNW